MEFKYLSHLTGDYKYWDAVEKVMKLVHDMPKKEGLCPIFVSPDRGGFVVSL
jgi:endoplasmic reticulum Man9GlcNAc2 1,2-alpha-mannosidase